MQPITLLGLRVGLLAACLAPGAATAEALVLYFEERPPLVHREHDRLTGAQGQPAMAALQRAGVEVELHEAPVARQVALVQTATRPTCALGLYRTAEREKLGKYSQHPVYISPPQALLMLRDGRLAPLSRFAQVLASPKHTLALRNAYSYGADTDEALSLAQARILRTSDNSPGRVRLVLRGAVDGTLFTAEEGEALIEQLGAEGRRLVLRVYPDTPPGAGRHFYCSKNTPDELLRALDAGLPAVAQVPPASPRVAASSPVR